MAWDASNDDPVRRDQPDQSTRDSGEHEGWRLQLARDDVLGDLRRVELWAHAAGGLAVMAIPRHGPLPSPQPPEARWLLGVTGEALVTATGLSLVGLADTGDVHNAPHTVPSGLVLGAVDYASAWRVGVANAAANTFDVTQARIQVAGCERALGYARGVLHAKNTDRVRP